MPYIGVSEISELLKANISYIYTSTWKNLKPLSLKCFHFFSGDEQYILVTGGDDNAVAVRVLDLSVVKGDIQVEVVGSGCHVSPHSAQITGWWNSLHNLSIHI